MRRTLLLLIILFAITAFAGTENKAVTLDIYVVDVEGGNPVLSVTPAGESVLIDTGNIGNGAVRDAGRIAVAAKDAGLKQIDHLIFTHYHGDHLGGLAQPAQPNPTQGVFQPWR